MIRADGIEPLVPMYTPPEFRIVDRAWVTDLIARHPFGLLVTTDAEYPRVSHLPFVAQERNGSLWLLGHVARANAHAQSILAGSRATIVFQGAHAYVSAGWYEKPYETVPTWNYTAAHICGTLRECDAWQMVQLLSVRFEAGRANPWIAERLDAGYRNRQLVGIIAFELCAEQIYAKAKLSQNRSETDRMRVIRKLSESPDATDRECAQDMRRQESLDGGAPPQ